MGWYEYDSETGYDYHEPAWFYAVAVGRSTGIFTSHEEAAAQVHSYPSFRMRKFSDYEDARDYLEEFDIYCESLTEDGSQEREREEENVVEGEEGGRDDSWFYAVAVGRSTGVFLDFEDARDQVYGYPRSRMEQFLDYDEAEEYIEQNQILYEEEEEKEEETKASDVWFYAVAVGRSTGVYMNYQEAVAQVHGYSGFRMKKFRDYEEAEEYIAFNQVYSSDEEEESEEEEQVEEEEIWYYAVAVGRTTGVYTDWQAAMEQVRGYSGFRMKKFLDYSEAQQYIRDNRLYYVEDEEEKSDYEEEEEVEQDEDVWYYAVAVGRCVGIYTSRDDALDQVFEYSGFRMKKFLDYNEAQSYIDVNQEYYSSDGWEESKEEPVMEKEEWFYAVAVGRNTGIYTNHEDAIEQVHGYPGFRMKKFLDYDEADEYLDFNRVYSSEEEYGSASEPEEEFETWYYAVAVGRDVGVYTDWQVAREQVYGYSGFRMKKFLDLSEAWEYVRYNKCY